MQHFAKKNIADCVFKLEFQDRCGVIAACAGGRGFGGVLIKNVKSGLLPEKFVSEKKL